MPTKSNPNLFSFEADPANTSFLNRKHQNGADYKTLINSAITAYRRQPKTKAVKKVKTP